MRGRTGTRLLVAAVGLAAALVVVAGCTTSTRSGLPEHIRTVEVHIFRNKTMYKSIEAWITRSIIDRINADPRIKVVSRNGDAILTGEIKSVTRSTLRETTTGEPATVLMTIVAEYSFYDNVAGRFLVEDAKATSSDTGLSPGIYEASRGGTSEDGDRGAANELAGEIVRRTVGMW